MNKIYLTIAIVTITIFTLSSFTTTKLVNNPIGKFHQNMMFSGGITGYSVAGCSCHGAANTSVVINISGLPTSPIVGTTYNLSLNVTGANAAAGFNLTVNNGTLLNANADAQVVGGELTHTAAKSLVSGTTNFDFEWTPTASGSASFSYAVNNANLNGNTGGDIVNNTTTNVTVQTLPITLEKFVGTGLNNGANALTWQVSQEIDFKQYEIERSVNGSNFQKIGTQLPINGLVKTYQFIDQNISTTNTRNYYRLKIVDRNNTFTYSPIITISTVQKQFKPVVFPNTINAGQPFIVYTGKTVAKQLHLINSNGVVEYIHTPTILKTNVTLPNTIKAGKYIILITNADKTKASLPLIIL
jgi:hypothetical protein